MTARVGAVCGLAAEAECLEFFPSDQRPSVRVAGASAARAHAAATRLVAEGCTALISFGVAGGLDPELASGTIVIAEAVIAQDGRKWATSGSWRQAVHRSLATHSRVVTGPIAGRNTALVSPEAKAMARSRTGAVAVDMESHGVAAAAADAELPFLILRAIADPAGRAIPEWITDTLAADGTVIPQKIAGRLFARPWTVWTLIGLARENGRALRGLRTVARRLGPDLALPER